MKSVYYNNNIRSTFFQRLFSSISCIPAQFQNDDLKSSANLTHNGLVSMELDKQSLMLKHLQMKKKTSTVNIGCCCCVSSSLSTFP
jgi:hypothetical protein